jgi:hypothetical protein
MSPNAATSPLPRSPQVSPALAVAAAVAVAAVVALPPNARGDHAGVQNAYGRDDDDGNSDMDDDNDSLPISHPPKAVPIDAAIFAKVEVSQVGHEQCAICFDSFSAEYPPIRLTK